MSRRLALVNTSAAPQRTAAGIQPLLETKLFAPRWDSSQVSRPRLLERIRRGRDRRLTVVAAPAGFGKTTLLAEWLAAEPRSAAWVSLDPSENDPALFWGYVMRALQRVHPRVDVSPQAADSFLPSLVNQLASLDDDIVLILDDYHVIEDASVQAGVAYLVEHMPARMHVIIASRAEPALPLARLRARGQLVELRPDDLRFTPQEASSFLHDAMALEISTGDIATLEKRTEGWIAGLKLAALSLQGRDDVPGFIAAFSGDNRFIADYLVEEVLQGQPERIQRFLLGTSSLGRLSGPLCDAVMDEPGSQALLESLERSNLFVVALDDRREWYRYHHLFADVLQSHSRRVQPERFRLLHQRASAWYEQAGAAEDAVRHALAAEDTHRAAALLERAWPAKDRSYQTVRWLGRVNALPAAEVRSRPVLAMGFAWALLNAGELEKALTWLDVVESWSGRSDGDEPVVADGARYRTLAAELASARVYHAQCLGSTAGTVARAQVALDAVPADDDLGRATGTALLALAQWASGELEAAHRTFADALRRMHAAGSIHDEIRGIFVLGDIRVAQGRLRDAEGEYRRGLQLAAEQQQPALAVTDELYLGLSEVLRERGDLDAATLLLQSAESPAAGAEHVRNRHGWCVAMSRIAYSRGDWRAALAWLEQAGSDEIRGPLPRPRPVPALAARIHVAQGRLEQAAQWALTHRVTSRDEPGYVREFEHVTLARLLLASPHRDELELHAFLGRMLAAAVGGGRNGSVIEIRILQALAHHAAAEARRALDALQHALELAEPEGFARVFVDEGASMRDLLRQATARGIATAYTRHLLQMIDAPQPAAAITIAPLQPQLLTSRELEVLRLIAAGLRNREIADQLFISAATVKRHIANAYNKLGASHRTEALARAQELKLL